MGTIEAPTRRRFFETVGKVATASLVPPLSLPSPPEFQWRSDQKEEHPPLIERPNEPLLREAIRYGNTYYLVGKKKVFPMSPRDFEEYRYKSMFDERGRRVFVNKGVELLDLPRGKTRDKSPLIDLYTGDVKFSSEVLNLFIPGSLTEGGIMHSPIPLQSLHPAIQGGLSELGWTQFHTLYFTWGKKELKEFSAADTVKDPEETSQNIFEYMDYLEENLPYTQLNTFEHSYGVVVGDEMAKRYPHMINTRVTVSGPSRGLDKIGFVIIPPFDIPIPRGIAAYIFSGFLRAAGIDERMTARLFSNWNDKKYQRELDESAATFEGMGRAHLDLTSVDDLIVPVESTLRRGKVNELNGRRVPSAWKLLLEKPRDPVDALIRHHWALLKHPLMVGLVKEAIGENRAAA